MTVNLYYPPSTVKKIKDFGLTEKQLEDVYMNGDFSKLDNGTLSSIRKYNGYEIGIYYVEEKDKITILTCWKRDRR